MQCDEESRGEEQECAATLADGGREGVGCIYSALRIYNEAKTAKLTIWILPKFLLKQRELFHTGLCLCFLPAGPFFKYYRVEHRW